MINKYTIRFIDEQFEKQYQAYMFKQQVYPLIIAVSIGLILISINGIINGILRDNMYIAAIRLMAIILSIFSMLLVRKWPCLNKVVIFLALNFSLLYQLSLDEVMDKHYSYLMGLNVMVVNLSVLVVSDFVDGSINNILIFLSRIIVTINYSNCPYTEGYQCIGFITIVAVIGLYYYNYNKRMQFYLSHKDSQWEQMLPKLINTPFILFNYNEEQVKFNLNLTNIQGDSNHVIREVLRNYHIGTITLEQFIHSRIIKNETKDHTRQLALSYNDQPINVQYSEFHIVDQMYLVVLPSQEVHKLEQKLFNQSTKHLNDKLLLLNRVQQSLFKSIRYRDWQTVIQLYSNILEKKNRVICKYCDKFEVEEFSLTQMIQQMNLIRKNKFSLNVPSEIILNSIKPLFQLFLNLLVRASVQNSKIIVKFLHPNLRILGWFDVISLEEDQLFNKTCQKLFQKIERVANGFNFEISDQPMIGFTNQWLLENQ